MLEIKLNDKQLKKELKELIKKTKTLKPVMRAIAEDMHYAVLENFETQGERLGKPWKTLSTETQKNREENKYHPDKPKLQRERKLYDSITSYYDKNTAVVGSNLAYAKIHQFGGEIQNPGGVKFLILKNKFIPLRKDSKRYMGITKPYKINIPARPFLGLNDNDVSGIRRTIRGYLE